MDGPGGHGLRYESDLCGVECRPHACAFQRCMSKAVRETRGDRVGDGGCRASWEAWESCCVAVTKAKRAGQD